MVVIKKYTSSQISELANITGRVLYDSTLNILKYNNSASYSNILVHKDDNNNLSSINDVVTTGTLGINTSSPDKQVEINSSSGECLRLTYNDNNGSATNYSDFTVSNSGDLTITPSGNDTTLSSTLTVNDATTLSSTLDVTGSVNLNNDTDATSSTNGGSLTVDGGAAIAKKLFVGTDLTVGGDLFVSGTTTTVNSTTVDITDNILKLNSGPSGSSYDSGLIIERFQSSNDLASGDVISDIAKETQSIQSATNNTITLANTSNSTNDYYKGWWVKITSGSGIDQVRKITAYNGTTKVATLENNFTTNPSNNDTISLYNKPFSTLIWQESNNRFITAFAQQDVPTGQLQILDYADFACNGFSIVSTTPSTSNSTGALVLPGGIGISNTTDATSSTNGGTFTTAGGAAIAKKLYVGTDLNVGNDLSINRDLLVSRNLTVTGPILAIPTGDTASRPNPASGGYIRYNTQTSQFEGYGAGNAWGSLGGVSDVNQDTKILAEDGAGTNDDNLRFFNNGSETMRLTSTGLLGLGTNAPDKQLEINSTTGDCLRLTYNDANGSAINYTDFSISNSGDLTISPSGNDTTFNSTLSVSDVVNFNDTTDATSSTAGGALTVDGGAAIAKKLYVGTDLNIGGNSTLTGTLDVTGATTLSSTLDVTGLVNLNDTTDSSSSTSGALIVDGGVGIAKKLFVGTDLDIGGNSTMTGILGVTGATTLSSTLDVTGLVNLNDTTDASSSTSGALIVDGGVGIAKKLFVGTDLDIGGNSTMTGTLGVTGATTLSSSLDVTGLVNLNDTTDASSSTSGALIVDGGVGIAKKLFVGTDLDIGGDSTMTGTLGVTGATTLSSSLDVTGLVNLNDTTDASSSISGALIVDGGVGIAKKLFVGTDLDIGGDSTMAGTLGVTGATTLSSSLDVTGLVNLNDTTDASSSTSGALIVDGGVGIAKKLYVGTDLDIGGNSTLTGTLGVTGATTLSSSLDVTGLVNLNDATDASSSTSGALIVDGGVGIAKKLFVGTDLDIGGNSTMTGTLDVTGATTLSSSLDITGLVNLNDATDASSSTSGALIVDGGVGIAKKLYVGTDLAVGGNLTVSGTTTTVNSTIIEIRDNTLKLNSGPSGSNFDSGFVVERYQTSNDASTGDVVADSAKLISTLAGASTNTITLQNTASSVTNYYKGWWIKITSGSGNNQVRKIASYDGTTKVATLETNFTINPSTSDSIELFNKTLSTFVWQESNNRFITAYAQQDISSGQLQVIDYADFACNGFSILSADASTSTTTGALTLAGGIGIANTTDAISSTNGGTITTAGGAAIAKKLFVGTDLSIGGNSSLTGTLGVIGATTLSSSLDVTGLVNLNNTTDASSSTNGALIVDGGVGIAKKLFVGTDLSIGGNSSLTGTLGVTGATTLSSTLGVTGATNLSSTLGVTGAISFTNTTDATNSTTGGCLTISGGVAVAKKLFVGTDLSIGGNSTLTGTLGVTGATTLSSTLGVTGATTLSSTLGVTGATTLSNTLSVTGTISFTNITDATSSTSGGCLTISGGTAIAKKLFVGTDLSIGGNSTLTGTLGVTGATTLSSTLGVTGAATLSSTLAVTGATTLSSTLAVTGNSTLTGNVGIGTTSPDKKVEINSSTGDCLRLTYDDADGTANNYVDILVTSSGDLTLTPSGSNIDITTHNGSTTGLKLNGTLVTSTATELNYVDTTPGLAEASKALILDANRDIVNINYLEAANGVFLKPNSSNNTIDYPLSLIVTPNTEASVGLGIGIEFNSVNDNDDIYNAAYINFVSSDISNNSESGYFDFKLANVGTIDSVMTLSNNGVLTCTSFVETSDRRVKENIQDTISLNSLDKILQVNVKTYNFIKDSNKVNHTGIIAQELKEIIPEAVVVSKKEELDDFHSIHYTELVPHLINCIKELHKEVQDLKESLNKKN
jgi:enhancing lycopene biosynthesis protein 2